MTLPSRRVLNGAGFIACAGLMGYALYAEHVLFLMPCPLCVFQRMAVIATGIVFVAAAVHDPSQWGRRIYAALLLLTAGSGVGVAARHVWLQNLPPDQVPTCGPGFDYIIDAFPLAEALKLIFTGSGECATVDWQFLGLSMPTWVIISMTVVGGFGIWNNLRRA